MPKNELHTINDYFVISFTFYAIAAFADYSLHHPSLFDMSYTFAVITVASFAAGTATLALPIVIVRYVEWRGKVFVPPVSRTFGFLIATAETNALAWAVLRQDSFVRAGFIIPTVVSWCGLVLALKSRKLTGRIVNLSMILIIFPWVVMAVAYGLGIQLFTYPSP
jgi:hypothetical protein